MMTWRTLRGLVHSKPLVAANIVLVAVPVLAIVHSLVKPWLGQVIEVGPLSPWIKLAYFASLVFLVAGILYGAFCPEVIKTYSTEIDMIAKERDAYMNSNPTHRLEITLAQLAQTEDDHMRLVNLAARRDTSLGADRAKLDDEISSIVDKRWADTVQRHLAKSFRDADGSLPVARWVCALAWIVATLASVVFAVHRISFVFSA